jgi:hypothetical protein
MNIKRKTKLENTSDNLQILGNMCSRVVLKYHFVPEEFDIARKLLNIINAKKVYVLSSQLYMLHHFI